MAVARLETSFEERAAARARDDERMEKRLRRIAESNARTHVIATRADARSEATAGEVVEIKRIIKKYGSIAFTVVAGAGVLSPILKELGSVLARVFFP